MTGDDMTRAVHYQMADPGTRWIKDAEVAVDSDGPLDADAGPYPERDKGRGGDTGCTITALDRNARIPTRKGIS